MDSRRDMMKKMAVAAAVASVPLTASVAREQLMAAPAAAPSLLAPLERGSAVGLGWAVGGFELTGHGVGVLRLAHAQLGVAEVHLHASGGAGRAVAHTHFLDLVVMDGGGPTEESLARALQVVAEVVRRNELADVPPPELAALVPLEVRIRRFGAAPSPGVPTPDVETV